MTFPAKNLSLAEMRLLVVDHERGVLMTDASAGDNREKLERYLVAVPGERRGLWVDIEDLIHPQTLALFTSRFTPDLVASPEVIECSTELVVQTSIGLFPIAKTRPSTCTSQLPDSSQHRLGRSQTCDCNPTGQATHVVVRGQWRRDCHHHRVSQFAPVVKVIFDLVLAKGSEDGKVLLHGEL